MIKAKQLIELFERMYSEHWSYVLGSAKEGCVDCSGAFVWAYKQFGEKIYHGSNTIFRKYVGTAVKTPVPGYAAFKLRNDGNEPKGYQADGIGNMYHIGLVDASGAYVLNAKSSKAGFCRDKVDSWTCFAPLNAVDYDEDEDEAEEDPEGENAILKQYLVTVWKDGGLSFVEWNEGGDTDGSD